ncbi:hypothetical protein CBOM_05102 [Ceraceosorus bombacis]|uniref:Uncharacterized protein n=1 Tax=Ceraceosorus bombacis TaxID=401625 RepID=A0A0N7LA86_9BASI|nr:hypothetical protein CBOM_05102 [Ceraceosorus bombacis]
MARYLSATLVFLSVIVLFAGHTMGVWVMFNYPKHKTYDELRDIFKHQCVDVDGADAWQFSDDEVGLYPVWCSKGSNGILKQVVKELGDPWGVIYQQD